MKLTEEQDKDKKQQEDDAKRRDNPFYDKRVVLHYTLHCDDKLSFNYAEVPPPVMESVIQGKYDDKEYTLKIKTIAKNFPIELKTEEHTNCSWLNLVNEKHSHSYLIENGGVNHVNNSIYKDTLNLKDEDVGSFW